MAKRRKRAAPKKHRAAAKKRRAPRRRRNPGIPVLAVNPRRAVRRRRHHTKRRNPGGFRRVARRASSKVLSKGFLENAGLLILGGALAVGVSRLAESKVSQPPKVLAGIELALGVGLLGLASFAKLPPSARVVASGAAAGMGFSGGGKLYDAFMLPAPAATPAPSAGATNGAATGTGDYAGYFGAVESPDDLDGLEGMFGAVDTAFETDDGGDPLFDDDLDPFGGAAPYS